MTRAYLFSLMLVACWSSTTTAFVPTIPSKPASGHRFSPHHRAQKMISSRVHGLPQRVISYFSTVTGIELLDVVYDDTSTAFDAWEWTNAIGAPAALVAGAVLVTLCENRESMAPRKSDPHFVRVAKQTMRFLLLTSFALEVVSIFVGNMTGSVLLGHSAVASAKQAVGYGSPLQLLHFHHEFEYLTTQICFLQGLLNWLAAVAVDMFLPKKSETKSARRMNKCSAAWLVSLIMWIMAFYNNHLNFYADYLTMIKRFCSLFVQDYIFPKAFRPMSLLYGPSFLWSAVLTWRAFKSPPEDDEEEEEAVVETKMD